MKRISGLLVVVLLLVGLCACEQSTEAQWREQYDLGVRYLSEGNYEAVSYTHLTLPTILLV